MLKRVPDTVLVDIDIGVLLNQESQDSDTRGACEFLKKNCSALIFGNILPQVVAVGRERIVGRVVNRMKADLVEPVVMAISAAVEKQPGKRAFKMKWSGVSGKLTATVYLEKQQDDWKFLDIQDVKVITTGVVLDKAEQRTRMELEGWIPHGY